MPQERRKWVSDMGINLADRRMVAAWKAFAEEHPKRWAEYDVACNCAICTEYRRDFHLWFEERKAAQAAERGEG
jgi:hypothetical protein